MKHTVTAKQLAEVKNVIVLASDSTANKSITLTVYGDGFIKYKVHHGDTFTYTTSLENAVNLYNNL